MQPQEVAQFVLLEARQDVSVDELGRHTRMRPVGARMTRRVPDGESTSALLSLRLMLMVMAPNAPVDARGNPDPSNMT